MVRETRLSTDNLICPVFVCEGKNVRNGIKSMPGCFQLSIDNLLKEAKEVSKLNIPAIILFGIPKKKDEFGSEAYTKDGIIQKAIRRIKNNIPELIVITDICLCEYTNHGHCGVIKKGKIDNDATIDTLTKISLSHAEAGADIVAPSDMMDGRVKAIRKILDENGFEDISIMSYAAKYASSFYAPFREAAESRPEFGDRKSHQIDPANSDETIREIAQDIEEGADIVMVKPALPYLDIIYRAKQQFNIPLAAFQVSGEYSMIKAGGKLGWIDEKRIMMESLLSIKRAGADMIITYFAKEAARLLAS
ncbi:MAG: delta-aminolevulinic acid dehydratase [Candidatus Schekmanbacteria bacterium RIFCSPHIGHO2_02_FULL_38_11]|uniref:Delta-aminolevulinic acid dehydratase n=1 Tax=Candidatus Schekmanbacteria bacterium RIFCSPLOWO2_12_FULL_38_15 TaxID=1817883 RepID=A0A1F7SGS3_9BACT|nr:MAG: delta-aminolevulinic acid dehydratase [Candidatus Schekmanbacteria bacterium GWA2_38_9]OGL49643.1 MAG: delta-aminolevulinic acid dehydratase [Candidatus Schekmanbacteria bacterium RIFCSPLOWO2_02_FULL_38_14]OGL50365.1 MAG: delta-aminolevulinic acid dehydratase [Candidatus Schekmanbacteria bacterium RIFCSPHIGHO2_02_FULL_38_11]OGL52996.1 MAG: delta-aminolevulinic acid dehydratase [Candidatus Schekmanbacteria bacterium RIFCSPLOWO2_12_FULL_38_15]